MMWKQILLASLSIGLMLWVWTKVTAMHQKSMKDVDPCRLRGGCAGCNQLCKKE